MNMLDKWMHSLAAEMTPPPAYGTVHILLIVIGLTLCISLAWFCRKFDERKNKILLLTFWGVLVLSEVFKQLFLYYVTANHSICWGEFPFQMCSLPMYLCPVAVFSKHERVQKAAYSFMMCFNLLGGFAGAFEPSGVFLDQVALTIHAVAWHFSLIFLGFYIIFSRRAGTTKQHYFDTVGLFVLCCFIAFVINTLLGITVGAEVNMFFVGPNPSPIIVFSNIAKKFGWGASTLIYIPVTCLAAALIFWLNQLKKKA
ncbi:MAG: YwaF family protein [Clostridia bacterium]|nr:YwaF family protein [Clostridia bacterium]